MTVPLTILLTSFQIAACNPKHDKTKNDAMLGVYPWNAKPIIRLRTIADCLKLVRLTQNPKTIFPKIEITSNDLSQIEATCLLTTANASGGGIPPPAMKCPLQQQRGGYTLQYYFIRKVGGHAVHTFQCFPLHIPDYCVRCWRRR